MLAASRLPLVISALAAALSLSACEGQLGSGTPSDPPPKTGEELDRCTPEAGDMPPARLLTRIEYDNTVRDLLGDNMEPAKDFPVEPEVGGFNNNARSHLANPLLVESYANAARQIADRAVAAGIPEAECMAATDAACAESFVETFGARAFRRPLTRAEVESFQRLFEKGEPLGYESAIGLVIEAMLQSPQFLYRVEAPLGVGVEDTEVVALGPYEIASRLSYFVWGSMPDETLMAAAAADELRTKAQVRAQVERLLDDPRAVDRVRDFHLRWLGMGRFDTVAREGVDAQVIDAWRTSLLDYADDVFWREGATVSDLFSGGTAFLNADLAGLYGHEVPADDAFHAVELEDTRAGLLTQPGLMAMLAHPEQSSPIQRGVFVREHILCNPVPAPPPSVNSTPPDPDPELTTRERFAVHTEDATCAACHALIDPLGFGFEEFDQLGRYRSEENDMPIDASGDLTMMPAEDLNGEFDGAAELSARLADSPVVAECLTRYWYRYATGRMETPTDGCNIEVAAERVEDSGGSFREVLISVATSDAFRYRPPHTAELTGASAQEDMP